MSEIRFLKKDIFFLVFFTLVIIMLTILKYFIKKLVSKFSDIFSPMDNEKGKKGKLFFTDIFLSIHTHIIYEILKYIMTMYDMDNKKGKKR